MQQCESEAKIKNIEKKIIAKPKKMKEEKTSIPIKIVETENSEKNKKKQEIYDKADKVEKTQEKEDDIKKDANIYESILKKIDEDHDLDENDINQYLN